MPPPLAYDLTRLCYAPPTLSPRGIDRVEMGLAHHFFTMWPADCVGILPTPWGVRCVDRRFGQKVAEHARAMWREDVDAADDPAYAFVKAALTDSIPERRHQFSTASLPAWRAVGGRVFSLAKRVGVPFGPAAVRAAPRGAIYLNIGHVGLALDYLVAWLDRRPDIFPVFMLHDAIPLDHPELVSPSSNAFYKKMCSNTARRAKGLIVTTQSAKRSILSALGESSPSDERIIALRIPAEDLFRQSVTTEAPARVPYFVFCGSIEPRKNLTLLLEVWKNFAMRLGASAPKLVVVGERGWGIGQTADLLDDDSTIRDQVIEVEGLSTHGLHNLLAGARALLAPSFVEGYGIPIVEALASGTPAIASDIPAHREAGGDAAIYLDPNDIAAWESAILAHCTKVNSANGAAPTFGWSDYRIALDDFFTKIASED